MNDIVSIKMTLTQANCLRSILYTTSYDLRESDPQTAKKLEDFSTLVQDNLDKLDFSDNERWVDEFNAKQKKEANR